MSALGLGGLKVVDARVVALNGVPEGRAVGPLRETMAPNSVPENPPSEMCPPMALTLRVVPSVNRDPRNWVL